jgi:nickel/cobalt transporter (NiCoT) family protein
MCLLDTFDGAAMMSLYTSARLAKDAIAVLYYQCVLTAITVVVAIVIGVIQLLNLIYNVKPGLHGPFWRGVEVAGDQYDIIGGSICGSFIVFGGLSVLLYRPWRRRIDRKRLQAFAAIDQDEEEDTVDVYTENEQDPIDAITIANTTSTRQDGPTASKDQVIVGSRTAGDAS